MNSPKKTALDKSLKRKDVQEVQKSTIESKKIVFAVKNAFFPVKTSHEASKSKPVKKFDEVSKKKIFLTGIDGFDALFVKGIPKGLSVLVSGGPGTGKTIFCLQTAFNAVCRGEKCLYITFEESPIRLREHMEDFEWDIMNNGELLRIEKFSPFDISRQVEAMLAKAKGELLIDVKPLLFPEGFQPSVVVIDSLSAISSMFLGQIDSYRVYLEQLFVLLNEIGATSFLIAENGRSMAKPSIGAENFLADGIIAMYSLQRGSVRENMLEILKVRGAGFQKKLVPFQIQSGKGIVVYPEQEVFGETTG